MQNTFKNEKMFKNENEKSRLDVYPKLNLNEDPSPARLDVTDEAGIVSDRCRLLLN